MLEVEFNQLQSDYGALRELKIQLEFNVSSLSSRLETISMEKARLEEELAEKTVEIDDLKLEVSSLNEKITGLQRENSLLESQVSTLEEQLAELRRVNVTGEFNSYFTEPDLHEVVGYIVNYGVNPAYDITITFYWTLANGTTIYAEMKIEYLPGRAAKLIYDYIHFTGMAVSFYYEITYYG